MQAYRRGGCGRLERDVADTGPAAAGAPLDGAMAGLASRGLGWQSRWSGGVAGGRWEKPSGCGGWASASGVGQRRSAQPAVGAVLVRTQIVDSEQIFRKYQSILRTCGARQLGAPPDGCCVGRELLARPLLARRWAPARHGALGGTGRGRSGLLAAGGRGVLKVGAAGGGRGDGMGWAAAGLGGRNGTVTWGSGAWSPCRPPWLESARRCLGGPGMVAAGALSRRAWVGWARVRR
jgi:hypothetical protein